MSTITKARAQEIFLGNGPETTASEERELARIALASLEAEPVAYVDPFAFHNFSVYRAGKTDNKRMGREWMWANPDAGLIPVYTAQSAPANAEPVAWLWSHRKHPSEVSLVRPEDDERAEGAHWSGWSCQALYAAPPATVSVPDEVNVLLNHLEDVLPDEAFNLIDVKTWNNVSMLSRPDVYRAAMLQGAEPVNNHDELREKVRREHAEWSQATFGDVGPVGPLKHLSKEALEAAEEPEDLSEWADMQFLLWDAQRRAGISDGEITAAMEEKLKVNMARQWPEPKDGEPRLHIKENGNSPVIPDGWVACSERMPEREVDVQVYCSDKKEQMVGYMERNERNGYFRFASLPKGGGVYCQPTHWMPLPAAPQQEAKNV